MRKGQRLVIRRERPGRRRYFAALALVVLVLAIAAAYLLGERSGGYLRAKTGHEIAKLDRALQTESTQNTKLQGRIAFLGHALTLANSSASALKASLAAQQQELADLKQNLAFYEGLVTPPDSNGAVLRIAGLQLIPTASARQYQFQIVLVRTDGKTTPALKGVCKVTVSGTRNGRTEHLSLQAISPDSDDPLHFTLRYFANLAGTLALPSGFVPKQVNVDVQVQDQGSVSGSYSWPIFRG